jgi:uroporphyrinogen-III synthase
MRVVVTRPEHSGQKTAARLTALGHQAVVFPLSKPTYHPEAISAAFAAKTPASLAITSAEAITALRLADINPSVSALPLLVVGEASAKAAKDFGFQNLMIANGYATGMIDLLSALPDKERAALSPMLYLAGTPRGATFEDGLRNLRIEHEAVDAYQMEKLSYHNTQIEELIRLGSPDAVMFFSSEAVRDYFSQVSGHVPERYFNGTKFLCISEKVASELPNSLTSQSLISKDTSEQGIIDLLLLISGT